MTTDNPTTSQNQSTRPSWRDVLSVHPDADSFPMMSKSQLRELGEDIKAHGLKFPIVVGLKPGVEYATSCAADFELLDGRNRLAALELTDALEIPLTFTPGGTKGRWKKNPKWGLSIVDHYDCTTVQIEHLEGPDDARKFITAANLHRRHLNSEEKRDVIAALLKADPSKSDRAIGRIAKADNKTVASVRAEKVACEEIPHTKTRTDSGGRQQPSRKPPAAAKAKAASPKTQARMVQDVGENSGGEVARLRARIEEQDNEIHRLAKENLGLRSEIEELQQELSRLKGDRSNVTPLILATKNGQPVH
jgi:ParB-like chromosome segregation protein Spo0J